MTSAVVDHLTRHMAHVRDALAAEEAPFGRPELMEKAVAAIRARVNGTGGPVGADRIREALALVEKKGIRAACDTHLRYLCWALNEPWRDGPTLLGRPDGAIQVLLERAGAALEVGMLALTAWRGLLAGYLGLDARPTSGILRSAWLALREFLAKTLDRVVKNARFRPDWLEALVEHRNVLAEDPCRRYASSVFVGETQVLIPLRDAIGIPEQSWFWQELVLSQVKVLCDLSDDRYVKALDRFLPTLEAYPTLADDALVLILRRHHASLASQPHQALQDFAVARWGSPHLHAQAKWGLVDPAVKQMVREWIVREDLKLFFDMLSADGVAETRRLDFWLRFAKQIDFAHFALGPTVYEDPREDYVRLRKRRKERISRLVSPGNPDNNAFILKIGDHFLIEFGQTGNAAYGYRIGETPFRIPTNVLDLGDLKNQRKAVLRQTHNGDWEHKFLVALAGLGIHPDHGAPQRPMNQVAAQAPRPHGAAAARPQPPSAARMLPRQQPQPRPSDDWAHAAKAVAGMHGLLVEDQRPKGGCLWVGTSNPHHPARHDLEALGFKYTPGRGFWRKK